MTMLSADKDKNPFRALVSLTQSEITGYLTNALTRRGYTDVRISYEYDDNGSNWDRFASPILKAIVTAAKDGKPETETITREVMCETIYAELVLDGHTVDRESPQVRYSRGEISGGLVLLVPRTRS